MNTRGSFPKEEPLSPNRAAEEEEGINRSIDNKPLHILHRAGQPIKTLRGPDTERVNPGNLTYLLHLHATPFVLK